MDTKWKNRKKATSFIVFFAGVSLTLGGGIELLQNLPGDFWRHPDQVLQDDYQQSYRFRDYIAGHLENFLAMATDSYDGYYNCYDSYDYYGYAYPGIIQEGVFEREATDNIIVEQPALAPVEDLGMSAEELEDIANCWQNYSLPELTDDQWKEKRREQCQKLAQQYHEGIKKDQNLLYSIAYDGKVLYSNSELLPTDGSLTVPEDYNFLLQYAEGKVRIFKDGQELDVYGDGYYRDGSEWYVPGYHNFTVDDEMKKAVIYMAVAREPVLYTESSYARSNYQQMDNTLYWLRYNTLQTRTRLICYIAALGGGLALLIPALLCRKSRREANAAIARFTGKVWFECKILLFLLVLYVLFLLCVTQIYWDYGDVWYEWEYMIDNNMIDNIISRTLCHLPSWSHITLFWLVYLAATDLRRNRKVWQHGLIAKLYRAFSARDLGQPLSVKSAHRNGAAFAAAAAYGLMMLAGGVLGYAQGNHSAETVWGVGSLFFLILVGFLALQYRIGAKNMETARDLEALSKRISDIRSGNYAGYKEISDKRGGSESGNLTEATVKTEAETGDIIFPRDRNSRLAGHDLEDTIAQLEDIRQGMACAVDEQMKSERMKVELIANVSHDIKTPLTSIISYVQFLKEEKELPAHVQDYVKILDEKSQRLKNMVQDVFAVSKAASGELPMHMEELDFGKLLCQTLADMEEQIGNSKVTFRTEIPESPVMILADGQRLYRVFQNLFQNAIQYSLDGSRVFVTLQTDGCLAVASVKNTSYLELEKDKDFTERFARGDQSRTDGGSGLGLSIAQSFTEACGGTFSWETNADLFVVTVSFRILGNKA